MKEKGKRNKKRKEKDVSRKSEQAAGVKQKKDSLKTGKVKRKKRVKEDSRPRLKKGFFFGKRTILFFLVAVFVAVLLTGAVVFWYLVDQGKVRDQKVVNWTKKVVRKINPVNELKIGWVTDIRCYGKQDDETGEKEINWRCIEPLESMIWKMDNETEPDLIVQGGSLIKNKGLPPQELFIAAIERLRKMKAPVYSILGEDEVRNFSKEQWRQLANQSEDYYYIDKGAYRLIFLDTNHYQASEDEEVVDSAPGRFSGYGVIDEEQLAWLEEVLKKSQLKEVLIFMYHPPIYTDLETEEQSFERGGGQIRNLFGKYDVRAVFSGYLDRLCRQMYQGVEYFVLQGVWESNKKLKDDFQLEDGGVFGEISISEDEVDLRINYHRDRGAGYYNLEVTPSGYSCLDGYTLREKYQENFNFD